MAQPATYDLAHLARRIRARIVRMSHAGKAPHLGSALSCVDILTALYWSAAKVAPESANAPTRDRVILSKGHAAAALYATLAERGFFDRELLATYAQDGTHLPEQMSPGCVPGVEVATGSLGHGLSLGLGMALAGRIQNSTYRVWVVLSDGECNEGSVWEAALFAAAQRLDRVTAIIDYNRWQATGRSDEILQLQPLDEKWRAFGWSVQTVDGHDPAALVSALAPSESNGRPRVIVARTIKGRGVSFMEDDNNWHYRIPNADEVRRACAELADPEVGGGGVGSTMRDAFAQELEVVAASDRRVVLLAGDIGNRMFNSFRDRWPDRFYNCGVAEANMMSVAAGLALCGLHPVVYTIVPFVTTRCLEQIRVDVCYHRSPVTIVGVGGGLSYAGLGATHHSCEDIAFLRQLPGMTVVCPGDAHEVRAALRASIASDRPVYLRLGKKGEPVVHPQPPAFTIGKGIVLREGRDACLLSTGNILPSALAAADRLSVAGVAAGVVSLHTVKPLDEDLLRHAFSTCRLVATVEEHSVLGGLGGAVAEWLSEQGAHCARLLRLGTPDRFLHSGGSEEFARQQCGIDTESLTQRILLAWRELTVSQVHR